MYLSPFNTDTNKYKISIIYRRILKVFKSTYHINITKELIGISNIGFRIGLYLIHT